MKRAWRILILVVLVARVSAVESRASNVTVEFDASGKTGMEGVLPMDISVTLSRAAPEQVTVDYFVSGGAAKRPEDFELADGTLVFEAGQKTKTIPLVIADDQVKEDSETVVIALRNPKGAKLGCKRYYCCTIADGGGLDLKVDFALPVWSDPVTQTGSDQPRPGTLKPGYTPWASPRWADMYDHGAVQLEDIDGTGVSMMLTTIRGGHMTLKVSGLIGALAGALPPKGAPAHDPICNSWIYNCDWPDNPWGDIVLAIYNLPAADYVLKSYHNHFNCSRIAGTDDPTLIDCNEPANAQPPLKLITVMSLAELIAHYDGTDDWHNARAELVKGHPEYWDYHGQAYFPPTGPLGQVGSGAVETTQAAHDVQPQQVGRDEQLVPSVVKFRTDGSAVFVSYQAGCCSHDNVRPSRDGGRAILNAFELKPFR
ncbi:MAG: Calx-beta domain-containing protein [Planctomycetota bacterium]|jgi:hypothetical protein